MPERLILRELTARPIVLKLKRPIVARIATITDWPVILIDLQTEEGIVGRSYLEPYLPKAMLYLIPALKDLGEAMKGLFDVHWKKAEQVSLPETVGSLL